MPGEPWYVAAFRDDYRDVYPHRDLAAAREEVRFLEEQGLGGRVLDLCCGFARHTLALLESGVDAFGLDLSAELLGAARKLDGSGRLAGRLVRADARAIPFRDASFDAVVVLFSSFGYFEDAGDRRMLAEIARVLRSGGQAFLDLMDPARVRAGLVARTERTVAGRTIEEVRHLEDGGRRVVKEVRIQDSAGPEKRWRENVRMYERSEIEAVADDVGLSAVRAFGSFRGEPYAPPSERLLLSLRRR
jgi:SAM-dependent methyltransferase